MAINDKTLLQYRVGGLLYVPAIRPGIADKLCAEAYPALTSVAFCLEDSIQDSALAEAEKNLAETLRTIREKSVPEHQLPLLFVRVRTPKHLRHVHTLLGEDEELLTGYILPKFDTGNGEEYAQLIRTYNHGREHTLFMMPILESRMIADIQSRERALIDIKSILDGIHDFVLNVRVGGNDFSNLYGLRRAVHQSIYEIGVMRDILVDIINVFSLDYVVSGPVWEYFGQSSDEPWAWGLRKELELDRLNGFIGKTAIHPVQLPTIYDSLKVLRADYEDAKKILNWTSDGFAVAKSADGSRMNEVKCHTRWAQRILTLGQIYGVLEG